MAWLQPSPEGVHRGSGSSPGSTLGSCSLCSVASVSSSLLRMMVWVGAPAGGRAVGRCRLLPPVRAVEPLDVELEVPVAVEAEGEDAGSGAPTLHRPAAPQGSAQPLTAARRAGTRRASRWCGSACAAAGPSYSWRRNCMAAGGAAGSRCCAMWACGQGRGQCCSGQTGPRRTRPVLIRSGATCWLHHGPLSQSLLTLGCPVKHTGSREASEGHPQP